MGHIGHKTILCDTRFNGKRTCVAKKSRERPIPCPRCEGYRAGVYNAEGQAIYESFVARRLVGWTPKNGIQVPLYTDGQRPKR